MSSTLAPGFLIAMPQLLDENFYRAVVLMLEHSSAGSLGIVINHRSSFRMEDFARELGLDYHGDPERRVFIGGPVGREAGWILHPSHVACRDSQPVTNGIGLSRSLNALRDLCVTGSDDCRLYMGYAGWGPGQLERELTEGAWITSELDADLVFTADTDDVWEQSLQNLGVNPMALVPGGPEIN